MSVAISDTQTVSFTGVVWKPRPSVQIEREKSNYEISMLWEQGEMDGGIVGLSLWDTCPLCKMASSMKSAASSDFWMNSSLRLQ